MRTFVIALFSFLFFVPVFGQNCQPDSSFSTPFIHPDNDSIPCIVRGVAYSTTLTVRIFDSIPIGPFTIPIDSLSIDSITNLPCGISWLSGKSPNKMYLPHELDCILIAGTTDDSVGQYHLGIHGSWYSGGSGTQYNFDNFGYKKFLRVKDLTTVTCPAIDDTLTGETATCSGLILYVVGHTEICQGDSTGLRAFVQNGNGHYTYLWSTGDTTVLIGVNQAGTYSVTVSDGSWTATASNTVRINPVVVPSVTVYPIWNPQDTSHFFCYQVPAKTGPTKADTLIAVAVNCGPHPIYEWLVNGQTTTRTDSFFAFNRYGSPSCLLYHPCLLVCKVTSSIACARPNTAYSRPDSISIKCSLEGGVDDFSIDDYVSIYPNPNSGQFAISIDQPCHTIVIELHDMQGALLYKEKQNELISFKKELDFSQLAKGTYLLKATTEKGVAVKRIVLE